jgi:23S rRNA (adenine2503-C2)-methyltransferase
MNNTKEKIDIKSLTLEEMREWFLSINEKAFHANQVYRWLYVQKVKSFEEMTNLSKSLREKLVNFAYISQIKVDFIASSKDGTIKIRYKLKDNELIESVLIPDGKRLTICISSQVGCAVGCEFCFTAKMGIRRNLTTSEIVNQVLTASEMEGVNITNIVFMGMGEPLNNFDSVVKASKIFLSDRGLNFSKRKVVVSTSGILNNILKLREEVPVRLALSLNSSTDKQRDRLIPINKKWNIESLISVLKKFPLEPKESITLEYVIIKNINDSIEDAKNVLNIVKKIGIKNIKVNVIPFNEHDGIDFLRPEEKDIEKFHTYLFSKGVDVLYRKSRGDDIGAACGQLVVPELVVKL